MKFNINDIQCSGTRWNEVYHEASSVCPICSTVIGGCCRWWWIRCIIKWINASSVEVAVQCGWYYISRRKRCYSEYTALNTYRYCRTVEKCCRRYYDCSHYCGYSATLLIGISGIECTINNRSSYQSLHTCICSCIVNNNISMNDNIVKRYRYMGKKPVTLIKSAPPSKKSGWPPFFFGGQPKVVGKWFFEDDVTNFDFFLAFFRTFLMFAEGLSNKIRNSFSFFVIFRRNGPHKELPIEYMLVRFLRSVLPKPHSLYFW